MQNQLMNHQNYVPPQIALNQNQDPRQQAAPIFHVSRGAGHENDLKDFLDWDQQINSDRLVLNEIQRENIRDYECCICDNFFLQPVECCECDETFCLGCIENYKQRCIQTKQQQQQQAHENQNNVETPCPTCQKELVFKKAHKNTRMRLANVHIKCIFSPDCNIIETYEKLQKHQLDCKFNKIRCPNFEKCKAYFKIQDRQDHLSHCIMNELKCDLCNHEDAIFESEIQLKIHKEYVCDQNIAEKVLCSFCNELMTKDMFLKTHLLCSKAVEQISDLKNQLSVIASYTQQNMVRNGIQNQAAVSQTVIRQFNGSNPHQQNFNQFMNNGQRPQNNLGVQQQRMFSPYMPQGFMPGQGAGMMQPNPMMMGMGMNMQQQPQLQGMAMLPQQMLAQQNQQPNQNQMVQMMFQQMTQMPGFSNELNKYMNQQGKSGNQNAVQGNIQSTKTGKGKKQVQAGPISNVKKPRNSFIFFKECIMSQLLAECPGQAVCQLMTLAGQKWAGLSEDEKKKYRQMAEDDKLRYKNEIDQEKKGVLTNAVGSIGHGIGNQTKVNNIETTATTVTQKKKKSDDNTQSTRPKYTSFVIFNMMKGAELKKTNPQILPQEITKLSGAEWKTMTDDQKDYYKKLADQKNAESSASKDAVMTDIQPQQQQQFQQVTQVGGAKRIQPQQPPQQMMMNPAMMMMPPQMQIPGLQFMMPQMPVAGGVKFGQIANQN
eukprot:403343559